MHNFKRKHFLLVSCKATESYLNFVPQLIWNITITMVTCKWTAVNIFIEFSTVYDELNH